MFKLKDVLKASNGCAEAMKKVKVFGVDNELGKVKPEEQATIIDRDWNTEPDPIKDLEEAVKILGNYKRTCMRHSCGDLAIPCSAFCIKHANRCDFTDEEIKKQDEFLEDVRRQKECQK